MHPVKHVIEAEPTLASHFVVHDRQDSRAGLLKGLQGGMNRICLPNNDRVTPHEIIDTLLAKRRRYPIDYRLSLLKGQILHGAPIQEVSQRQTVLGQCLECCLIECD